MSTKFFVFFIYIQYQMSNNLDKWIYIYIYKLRGVTDNLLMDCIIYWFLKNKC